MSDKATFHAAFEGASVTIQVDYARFKKGSNVAEILKAEWEGKPSPKIVPQYVSWMHTVMCQVAQRVHQEIFYAYPPAGGLSPQYFIYHADGKYESVQPPR
jgi:hypothetical protein